MRRIAGFRLLSCLTFICILSMTGCTRESVSDIESIEESQTMVMNDEPTLKRTENKFNPLSDKVEIVKKGDSGYVKIGKSGPNFTLKIEEVEMADNIYDMEDILGKEKTEYVYNFYKNIDNNNVVDEEGNVTADRYGIARKFMAMKVVVTSNNDKEFKFNSAALGIYNIRETAGGREWCRLQDGFAVIDNADIDEREPYRYNHKVIKPGETVEMILVDAVSIETVKEYTWYADNTDPLKRSIYSAVTTYGNSLDSMYAHYTATPAFSSDGSKAFEIKVDKFK